MKRTTTTLLVVTPKIGAGFTKRKVSVFLEMKNLLKFKGKHM